MKLVRVHSAGGYDHLRIETAPDPVPGKGEVLIDVSAAGVNFADCIVRMGLYASAKVYVGWPITPGFEVAGTVAALGEGVTDLALGAPVFAVLRFGGYATKVCAPRRQVFALPAGLSKEQAAAFPAVYLTAWYALFELARPRKGQRVLVHSAAGGVGGALCELCRAVGLRALGVVGGPHKVEVARTAGAEVVVDKSKEDLWAAAKRFAPEGYDIALDANGVETLWQSYRHTAAAGRLIVYGFHTMFKRGGGGTPSWPKLAIDWMRTPRFNPLDMTQENRSVLAFNLSFLFEKGEILTEGMTFLTDLLTKGQIHAPPVKTYPFDAVADAHRDLESGKTTGKLVLVT